MSTKKLLNNWKKKTLAGLIGILVVCGGVYVNLPLGTLSYSDTCRPKTVAP